MQGVAEFIVPVMQEVGLRMGIFSHAKRKRRNWLAWLGYCYSLATAPTQR